MIKALLMAGILGFLLGVAATFVFFRTGTPDRIFLPAAPTSASPQAEASVQPEENPAEPSSSPSPTAAPAPEAVRIGPPPTREELDEDD